MPVHTSFRPSASRLPFSILLFSALFFLHSSVYHSDRFLSSPPLSFLTNYYYHRFITISDRVVVMTFYSKRYVVFITQAYAQKSTRGTLGLLVPFEVGVRGGGCCQFLCLSLFFTLAAGSDRTTRLLALPSTSRSTLSV